LAYSAPAIGNAMSLRDAIEAKAEAKRLREAGNEEGARRAEAHAAAAAIGAVIPSTGGLTGSVENAGSKLGVFAPPTESKAELARALWQNMPRSYSMGTSPQKLNQAIFKATGDTGFGPEGIPKRWISDTGMSRPVIGEVGKTAPLGAVVEHPALFESLPWTAEIPVKFRSATPEGGNAKYYAPFARTGKEGGFEVSTNMKPDELRGQLAKLLSYRIGEKYGFAAAGRHNMYGTGGNLEHLDATQEAVRQNLLSENPSPGALPYFERLLKIQDKFAAADKAANTDPMAHPWTAYAGQPGKPLTEREAGKALSMGYNKLMAGNAEAQLARMKALHGDTAYPYEGVNMPELFVLPQNPHDPAALEEFLRNWSTYGQGARRGR
jgi:hypothetical protein